MTAQSKLTSMKIPTVLALATFGFSFASAAPAVVDDAGWITLFDGKSLDGWHVSTKTGHSGASGNKTGGKWEIVNGAITGSQDIPGNGGIIITDEKFGDFEVKLEMKNDFGPDSGLFLRSTEDGKAWQAMIDYHSDGNLMGIYGEGLGGQPHVRNYNFTDKVTEIVDTPTGNPPVALPVLPDAWSHFWRADQWNELRARITSNPPHIITWINGVKIMEWKEKEVRHPDTGGIALQVHGGGNFTQQFVRYKNIKVKPLARTTAAAAAASAEADARASASASASVAVTSTTTPAAVGVAASVPAVVAVDGQ